MANISTMFTDIGGATSSLFAGIGAFSSQGQFQAAAAADVQNEQFEREVGELQQVALTRKINMALGTEQADVAGAGFTSGGSALDLLRSSVEQGALEKSTAELQNTMQVQNFATEASAANAESNAAGIAGIGGIFGGVLKLAGAALAL